MSNEQVRAVLVRYYDEIWNQGRLEVCDELIRRRAARLPGCSLHD